MLVFGYQARILLVEALRAHEASATTPVVAETEAEADAEAEDDDAEADARTGGGEAPADRTTLPVYNS